MAELAIVSDGVVVNRIIGVPGFAGGIECDADVGIGWTYDGTTFTAPASPPAPAPTVDDVITERDRRLGLGFDYDFGGAVGKVHISTTSQDMAGWNEVTMLANALIASGSGTTTIAIVPETAPVEITAQQWQAVLIAAGTFRQPIWAASFTLEAMDPIPSDYASDSHWTA